jgi:hypothetical protein
MAISVLGTTIFYAKITSATDVTLKWDAVSAASLAGYRVYYNPYSGKISTKCPFLEVLRDFIDICSCRLIYAFMPNRINIARQKSLTGSFIKCNVVSEIGRSYYASELQYLQAQRANL